MTAFSLDRQQFHAFAAALVAEARVRQMFDVVAFLEHEVDGEAQLPIAQAALTEWDGIRNACAAELARIEQLKAGIT